MINSKNMFIKEISELTAKNTLDAGGKGASLGEMTKLGTPVPSGFVVLASAFESFKNSTGLVKQINSLLHNVKLEETHSIDVASKKIQELIISKEIPFDIKNEINEAFIQLNAKYVAVRSSATMEDSSEAAWAGQLESYLNTTENILLKNIKRCWASLYTSRAIVYRLEKGLKKHQISVAVVIQKMIQSDVSGVAFSVHPVTQNHNQLLIEAGFGLGEAIVSGQISPDSYVVDKTSHKVFKRKINSQIKALVQSDVGNKWTDLTEVHKNNVKLSDEKILKLAELVTSIENHYGFPVDVEWAIDKEGKIWIVQSRPITTLKEQNNVHEISLGSKETYLFEFEAEGLNLLFSDMLLMRGYGLPGQVEIYQNGSLREYIHKDVLEKTSKIGIKLFGSDSNFRNYFKKLEEVFKTADKNYQAILESKPSKKLIQDFLRQTKNILDPYTKTDPHYTDVIYKQTYANDILKRNLIKIERSKNPYRTKVNKLFLEKDNYFEQLVHKLAEHLSVRANKLIWYTVQELNDLFDDQQLDDIEIKKRQEAFVQIYKDEKVVNYFGKTADRMISDFDSTTNSSLDLIKGIVANISDTPHVQGKVKIINIDYSDFEKMKAKMNEMEKGDILVSQITAPELMEALGKAAAVVTDVGGMLSHAAIISRELNIPCIVGTEKASKLLKDGDFVEVDANTGIVKLINS